MPAPDPLGITAKIGGRPVGREEVLAWEGKRAEKVSAKLGLGSPPPGLAERRRLLVERKLELGHEELERRLDRELRWAGRSGRLLSALSGTRRRLSVVELTGAEGACEAMPARYKQAMEGGEEAWLLSASPDHYVLSRNADGVELVIETTGGSPLAARIYLDDGDVGSVGTAEDPAFPVQWVTVGRPRPGGPPSGGIRHQFRDETRGFAARLTIEFPAATPGRLVGAHQWHLACEFSNWIEAASAA